jgi:hypothetical protein
LRLRLLCRLEVLAGVLGAAQDGVPAAAQPVVVEQLADPERFEGVLPRGVRVPRGRLVDSADVVQHPEREGRAVRW